MAGRLEHWIDEQCAGSTPVFVAHNGRTFDFRFLNKEYAKAGLRLPAHWRYLDSLVCARSIIGRDTVSGSYSLSTLRQHFSIAQSGQAHRALPDAQVLAAVLPHLAQSAGYATWDRLLAEPCTGFVKDCVPPGKAPPYSICPYTPPS